MASAGWILRISWDEAWAIKQRAVERGLARKKAEVPRYLGIDEKAFSKGHRDFMSIICNLEGHVEWVAEDRTAESIGKYFEPFSPEELDAIEAVAMDMWRGYARGVYDHVPNAEEKIVVRPLSGDT